MDRINQLDERLKFITKDIPALSMTIGRNRNILYSRQYGVVIEKDGSSITNENQFDIASMSKILSGICFMKLIEDGLIALTDPIYKLFPAFSGIMPIEKNGKTIDLVNARQITWYHVLTHTSGMGWTRPKTRPSLPHLERGLDDIFELPLAYRPGEHVIYSDLGFILMGVAMEQITGKKLDNLVDNLICKPLGLKHTGYLRRSRTDIDKQNTIPTEYDDVFRHKRIWGEVHDENCWLMDGVAAHAGIFSTSEDMCRLAMAYQSCLTENGGILSASTVREMIREHASEDGDRRGLIWQLSGAGEKAYTRYLSKGAYGHSGFTGCFLWTDPQSELSLCLLSNDVYNGRDQRKLFRYRQDIMKLAVDLFN